MHRLNFAQKLKQKRFCWNRKWHKTHNWKNECFKFVELQMKACHDFSFCSKKLQKVAIQWSEKNFQLSFNHSFWFYFQSQGQTVPFLMIFFESRNSMKMKRTFNCHFGFAFTLFSESRNSMKMKKTLNCHFDFVFTAQASLALLVIFFESRNSMRWKRLSAVILACFQNKSKTNPFADQFWKLQFNEMKRTFNCHFGFAFKICSESRNSMKMKRTFKCYFDFIFTAQGSFRQPGLFGDVFWKSQFNENEKDFQLSFWLVFKPKESQSLLLICFESYNSMKWKVLSTVILALFSQPHAAWSNWWSF